VGREEGRGKGILVSWYVTTDPGFVQDRANVHQKPGGDTAGTDDPNWPNIRGI